jgi:hypothetical protein
LVHCLSASSTGSTGLSASLLVRLGSGSWRVLADIESGPRENEVITPWSQMPNLIQLVQGTEQALPLYDPVHGSGPGEVFHHMSVVQRGVRSRATTAGRCGLDRLGVGISVRHCMW